MRTVQTRILERGLGLFLSYRNGSPRLAAVNQAKGHHCAAVTLLSLSAVASHSLPFPGQPRLEPQQSRGKP
ncbi:hypothetical protein phiK7B1_142 [Pseudomonas phage phiK7B1]|nr:hypothetical protein phiK7B1_142 [Pseudomonas phage phiK7B1]